MTATIVYKVWSVSDHLHGVIAFNQATGKGEYVTTFTRQDTAQAYARARNAHRDLASLINQKTNATTTTAKG